jgi:hypothetical protein
MPTAKAISTLAFLTLAMGATPLLAQPVVPPAPVPSPTPSAPPPGSWTVTVDPSGSSVKIGQSAVGGDGRFVGSCRRGDDPGLKGAFTGYSGARLAKVDGQIERTMFEVRGGGWRDAYAVQLRYVAKTGSWEFTKILPPVFVDSFSRGGELVVLNSQREEVFTFDLTGSTNAARTMRATCGFAPAAGS